MAAWPALHWVASLGPHVWLNSVLHDFDFESVRTACPTCLLPAQDVIQRVQDLQASGDLTGVIDDRGKFIYITMDELESVAKYVRQHGRVSISELAESSNRLITLDPDLRRMQAAAQSVVEELSASSWW